MPVQNFELITEFQALIRRDFPVRDTGNGAIDLDPNVTVDLANGVTTLLEGEFLELDSDYKLRRGGEDADNVIDEAAAVADAATMPAFAVFAERGRSDTRAIGKVPVLFIGGYEADTRIWGDPDGGLDPDLGMPLYVTWVTTNGHGKPSKEGTYRGLAAGAALDAAADDAGGPLIHGYVTRAPADNGGVLRFVSVAP